MSTIRDRASRPTKRQPPIKEETRISTITDRASRPTKRQCAMLIAHLLKIKGEEGGRDVTRARLSPSTLQRLLGRRSISPQLLAEIGEWLIRAGWIIFAAGGSYGVIRLEVVEGWNRVSSKLISDVIDGVGRGQFDFGTLEYLLLLAKLKDEQSAQPHR
jgi:hypothetical protein